MFRLVRCNTLHLHKKWLFPAFQRQEHCTSEINWEKINGWQKIDRNCCPCMFCIKFVAAPTFCRKSVLRWLQFAMAKRHRLFGLQFFWMPSRPESQKKLPSHFTQLLLSIANSRTAPESSAYLPEIAWNKMWNTWLWLWTFPLLFRYLNAGLLFFFHSCGIKCLGLAFWLLLFSKWVLQWSPLVHPWWRGWRDGPLAQNAKAVKRL